MAKDVIKTQVFDSSKMKQQKVNSCFNSRRQQEPTRERVIDAKDGQAQSGGSERRGSGDVRVVDAFSRAGGEAAGERRRVDVTRGKPGFMGRGELRRDVKERRNSPSWQDDRELVKDRIHVNGIPPEVGEHELGGFFSAFGRVEHVVIIPVNAGFGFAQQRFFPPRLRYGFVTFFRGEAVVQHILKKEALVLRGYRLHVSPARERRIEVLERQQSQGMEGDRHHGAAPAPSSSRDWLKEQPSWRTMDGQGRALADQGRGYHTMGRNGKGGRHQGDHSGNPDNFQQQSMDRSSSQQPSSSHPVHHQMEPSLATNTNQFPSEPLHCPIAQEGFAMASCNEGVVPGMVNSAGTTPYIFYQQPAHPAAPYFFYHHGPMPMPYYPPMTYHHQPDMVPYSPAPQQQSELAPFYVTQPQSEPGQFLQPPAWQEISYTVPSLPATPLWQPGDPSVQQQYCVYQQQPQLVPLTYGGAPAAHFDPLLATTEQVPQQQVESQAQVETSSLPLPMRQFHPEEGEAAGRDRADWEDGGGSKGEWRPRFEPSSA